MFTVNEAHLILLSAITGLGAVRQTRSHIKATLGIGNRVDTVKEMLRVVAKIAEWAGSPLTNLPDVDDCARQVVASLNQ